MASSLESLGLEMIVVQIRSVLMGAKMILVPGPILGIIAILFGMRPARCAGGLGVGGDRRVSPSTALPEFLP